MRPYLGGIAVIALLVNAVNYLRNVFGHAAAIDAKDSRAAERSYYRALAHEFLFAVWTAVFVLVARHW